MNDKVAIDNPRNRAKVAMIAITEAISRGDIEVEMLEASGGLYSVKLSANINATNTKVTISHNTVSVKAGVLSA